ncbi:hypothetical protein PQU92_11380 [Asticcacaulis sp. BYS171W]|uniref:Uncharacterized protein n=1 Tax=Asticcacaulis aquaticus TaxID=2984212 RepID=A0ABT5HUX5_9CAUL|nr:hypothetical protein [Asticcacaulis aquaticus]MDC7683881.1 hypothetical protein [Asticcacaulis aquaticus]
MTRVGFLCVGLMLYAGQAAAGSGSDGTPTLMIAPRASQVLNFVPRDVIDAHSSGEVWLRCGWTMARRLTKCRVIKEIPEGVGFGDAAIKGFETYGYLKKVRSASRDGEEMAFRFVWDVK